MYTHEGDILSGKGNEEGSKKKLSARLTLLLNRQGIVAVAVASSYSIIMLCFVQLSKIKGDKKKKGKNQSWYLSMGCQATG